MKVLTVAAITACLLLSGNVMAQNIQIKVGDRSYTCELNGNDAAKDFASQLPLKLNLAVFVKDFRPSENLVPLGKLSPEALKAIQESGSKDVEISLVK